jgi:hypothetical protein
MFFQPLISVDPSKLQMNQESLYSSTPWVEANTISHLIPKFVNVVHPVITDATANCGGNTISFHLSGAFKTVNAVEINHDTCQMLINNLKQYHLPIDTVYCADYLHIFTQLSQDVIFIDCPWGGKSYRQSSCLDLYLSGTNIVDLCMEIFKGHLASLIVLKLPLNYHYKLLDTLRCRMYFHKVIRKSRHSYNICFLYT